MGNSTFSSQVFVHGSDDFNTCISFAQFSQPFIISNLNRNLDNPSGQCVLQVSPN